MLMKIQEKGEKQSKRKMKKNKNDVGKISTQNKNNDYNKKFRRE